MSLAEKLRGFGVPAGLKSGYEIFEPLKDCEGKSVWIFTYGLALPEGMEEVIESLKKASRVFLLVGYSKKTHDPKQTLWTGKLYMKLGWHVRFLPSCHLKAWIVGEEAYVGSCNFTRSTMYNYMWKTTLDEVSKVCALAWSQAAEISHSTDLMLVPQAKVRIV